MKKYEENLIWILDIETCKGFFTFSFSPLLHNYEELFWRAGALWKTTITEAEILCPEGNALFLE